MKIRIEDGKTIITTDRKSGETINKTKVKGLTYRKEAGTYTLSVVFEGKKYHIGNYKTIEEGKEMRSLIDKQIEEGTMHEWITEFKQNKVINSNGVKGLMKNNSGKYEMNFSYQGKKYYLGSFYNTEDALAIRKDAEKHREEGTFLEWYSTIKKERNENKLGVTGLYSVRGKYQLYVTTKGKRHFIGTFGTVEEAANVRKIADQKIAEDSFKEWYEEIEKSKKLLKKSK